MKIMILLMFSLIFQACTTRATKSQPPVETNSMTDVRNDNHTEPSDVAELKKDSERVTEIDYYDIKNSLGLVSANDKRYDKGSFIRFYNQGGSLWYEFTFYSDERNSVFKYENEEFQPFRYDTDDLVVLNCVGEDSRFYHVIVNEDTRLKKFVKKGDPILKHGTWEQYILDCFAVGFNSEDNPLREQPNGRIIAGDIPKHLTFHPEKIKGEWLKVRWYENNDDQKRPRLGWVRWRSENKIVLNLFETA